MTKMEGLEYCGCGVRRKRGKGAHSARADFLMIAKVPWPGTGRVGEKA